ncbi:DUF4173 domain-containing protein [Tateyamaria sp. syn59]|uniref:DUF4153 domain-containing protein n=1 Tax=Tateyamaria sp. syn59 TaxID=2576942 RepID=UPI001671C5ED|nr:DUF4173 domain-containing protein [Tateyamaria sp. syn59]
MQAKVMPGVPVKMKRDGWWLDDPVEPVAQRTRARRRDGGKTLLLLALIALGDVLVWGVAPGINVAMFAGAVLLAGLAVAWPRVSVRTRCTVAAGGVLSVLPLVELVQPLSVMIALAGLSLCLAALAGLCRADILRGSARLWWVAPLQCLSDGAAGARRIGDLSLVQSDLRSLALAWLVPAGATLLFTFLILAANPVLDRWVLEVLSFEWSGPGLERMWFWVFLSALIWPVLVTYRMRERLRARKPERATVRRPGLVNAGSVARSLVAFNLLFAVQTGMDILFLYGDATLPDGISPATYAHRGAYPLLVTALLAGLFAVLAQPFLAGRPVLRWLMLSWLAQTIALVVASLWRLDLYVEAFGLTRLRLAAYIWMWLVAFGLGLVVWQVWRDKPASWMMLRSGVLGAAVLYACAFFSFDARVAAHNLAAHRDPDLALLCNLSEDAIPALYAAYGPNWRAACLPFYDRPILSTPATWREWGFRNWRTRNSLQAMTIETALP